MYYKKHPIAGVGFYRASVYGTVKELLKNEGRENGIHWIQYIDGSLMSLLDGMNNVQEAFKCIGCVDLTFIYIREYDSRIREVKDFELISYNPASWQ